MLVLSRKKGEDIIIDGNIIVSVVEIKGDRVRIGIAAPRGIPVDRREVHDAKHEFQNPIAKDPSITEGPK